METRVDSELPSKMADLDIMEVDDNDEENENKESPDSLSRVLRKRKSLMPPPKQKPTNRRVNMKPRKHDLSENSKQIEALYLNKKVKALSQTLETIYEESKTDNTDNTAIGSRKVKRLVTFQIGSHYTKEKIKKRRAKIKKLLGTKSFLNRKKIPMHVFLKTIECLDLDEVVQSESATSVSE